MHTELWTEIQNECIEIYWNWQYSPVNTKSKLKTMESIEDYESCVYLYTREKKYIHS